MSNLLGPIKFGRVVDVNDRVIHTEDLQSIQEVIARANNTTANDVLIVKTSELPVSYGNENFLYLSDEQITVELWGDNTSVTEIQSYTGNEFSGYDVTTDQGVVEFVRPDTKNKRIEGSPEGFGSAVNVDSTAQLQKAIDENGFVVFPATKDNDTYQFTSIETTRKTVFSSEGVTNLKILDDGTYDPFITISDSESEIVGGFKIDANNLSKIPVQVNNGLSNVSVEFEFSNLNADLNAENYTAGLAAFNSQNLKFKVKGDTVNNTGHPNESVPRVVSIQDGATTFYDSHITSINCFGSSFVAGSCSGYLDYIDVSDCQDNGIYGISADITVGNMRYKGAEEALVPISNSKIRVGTLTVVGGGGYAVNPANSDSVEIADLVFEIDGDGGSPSGIARTRTTNTAAGSLRIGNIQGNIKPERLFAFDTGTLESFIVGSCNIDVYIDESIIGARDFLGKFNACKHIDISDMRITMHTGSGLVDSTPFEFSGLQNLERESRFNSLEVKFIKDDNTIDTSGFFRGYLAVENVTEHEFVKWRTDIGPFVRDSRNDSSYGIVTGGTPAIGYWYKGQELKLVNSTSAPFNARCTESGGAGVFQFVAY